MQQKSVQVDILPDGRMTTENAAKYTGFSVSTLAHYRMTDEGPPFVKIGGKVFYKKAQVDKWLRAKR